MLNADEQAVIDSIDESNIVHLLRSLIRERSDFPPGDTRSAIGFVAHELDKFKVPYQRYAKIPERESLVTDLIGETPHPVLLFHAHIDTVPAGNLGRWSSDPFEGELRDGFIFGRGAGDDKGSVTIQLAALKALVRAGLARECRVRLAVVADEESGGEVGTRWLHDEGLLDADAVLIGEQTNNQISVAERVACGIDLIVKGKSAHGAMPWEGENAVLKACRALTYLFEKLEPRLEQRKHPFLPPPTLNVGKIEGGIQWSIVPDQCVVKMDRRLLPGETREEAIAEIDEVLDQFTSEVEPLRYELHSEGDVAPNVDTKPDDPFVRLADVALAGLVEDSRPLIGYPQTSDGRWFAADGIPIIHFGPGDPGLAHAADEYVPVHQLVEGARFLVLLAMRWHQFHEPKLNED